MNTLMLAGAALAFTGALVFGATLFSSGGLNKMHQFRVLGELLSGTHGKAKRRNTLVGMLLCAVGAACAFGGVMQSDRQRAKACELHCSGEGYEAHRIGPNSERSDDQATWFVACICESPGDKRLEVPADSLVKN